MNTIPSETGTGYQFGRAPCSSHRLVWLRRDTDGHRMAKCDRPDWWGCVTCGERRLGRCGASSEQSCKPCAATYRRRVRRVAESGIRLPGHSPIMLTLTAPGDSAHKMPSGTLCRCTPTGGVDLAQWNASAGHRWNRFCQDLRRRWGFPAQYFKAAEVQARGALHFHVLIRIPAEGLNLTRREMREVRELAIDHGFGHEVDFVHDVNERAAGYCAKYASKAAGERGAVPWRTVNRQTGEVCSRGSYRTWTASRSWGLTIGAVKRAQADWCRGAGAESAAGAEHPPLDTRYPCYTNTDQALGQERGIASV